MSDLLKVVQESKLPVVLAFTATWCGPCKTMHSTLQSLSQDYLGLVTLIEVDAGDKEMVRTWNVSSVPTYVLVKENQEVDRVLGAKKEALKELFMKGSKS